MPQKAILGSAISHGQGINGTIIAGSPDVYATGFPVARVGDAGICNIHGSVTVATGSLDVLTNGLPTARVNDTMSCAAVIISGAITIIVDGA